MITLLLRRLGAHIKIKFIVVTLLLHYNIIDVLFVNTFLLLLNLNIFVFVSRTVLKTPRVTSSQNSGSQRVQSRGRSRGRGSGRGAGRAGGHHLLPHLPDLQLEADLAGEHLGVLRLELGRRGV